MVSDNVVYLTVRYGEPQAQTPWAGLVIGAALFVAVALLARRRARTHELRMASRPHRIVETAAIWAIAYTLMRAPGDAAYDGGPFGTPLGLGLLANAALFMVTALLLVGTADFLLDALAPRRTPLWLLLGPLLLAAFSIGLLAASQWMDIVGPDPGWREVMLAAGLLTAGLAWWSRLPSWESQASDIFD